MPHLVNNSGSMRLALELVQREVVRTQPGEAPPAPRLLATAAVEWRDQRDAEWWPFVRLPPLRIDAANVEALAAGLRDVLSGTEPGFSWHAGGSSALGLQIGVKDPGALVEVGVDLSPFLAEVAGPPTTTAGDGELALFRFPARSADLVQFAAALEAQLREVLAT